jgi:hypothetical protein
LGNSLQNVIQEFLKLSPNIFSINFKRLSILRKKLLKIHQYTLFFERTANIYKREYPYVIRQIKENAIMKNASSYFEEQESQYELDNSLFRAMDYLEKSIGASDFGIRTISAAIIGGGIGMLVTIFFRH